MHAAAELQQKAAVQAQPAVRAQPKSTSSRRGTIGFFYLTKIIIDNSDDDYDVTFKLE